MEGRFQEQGILKKDGSFLPSLMLGLDSSGLLESVVSHLAVAELLYDDHLLGPFGLAKQDLFFPCLSVCFIQIKVLLCSSHWPGIYHVAQARQLEIFLP